MNRTEQDQLKRGVMRKLLARDRGQSFNVIRGQELGRVAQIARHPFWGFFVLLHVLQEKDRRLG